MGEGGSQRDHTVEAAAVILRLPLADLYRSVDRRHLRVEAFLEGREIDKHLEKRARLPLRLGGAIELTFGVVAAAHHGENGTVRSHSHESRLIDSLRAAFGLEPARNDAFGDALQVKVERGAQRQILGRRADELLHVRTEHVHEIICSRRIIWRHAQGGWLLARGLRLLAGDRAGFDHGLEHQRRALACALEMARGSKRRRRAHEARQHRCLAQR